MPIARMVNLIVGHTEYSPIIATASAVERPRGLKNANN